ncbi:hypothetical protein SPI_07626 [Niveomyces insectorum RCEF 264]|uniref:Atos-like conserved domain-containing protein n=1 Tax=Niveomyces insectorum RCEF 264 TaxID=1081102 RepID=A0A167PG19_9HYPO|nr:hypothetical protein SPI_07626 [Niveomyces insectorum RCEF 264]
MPMFEDGLDLALDSERPNQVQAFRSPHKQPPPPPPPSQTPSQQHQAPLPSASQQAATTPSKPISIAAHATSASSCLSLSRRLSEESIRTEFCEGPLPDSPPVLPQPSSATRASRPSSPPPTAQSTLTGQTTRPATPPRRDVSAPVTDRAELIERLKRGESPTWIPNRHLESLFHTQQSPPSPTPNSRPPSAGTTAATTSLLPAADIAPEKVSLDGDDHKEEAAARFEDGLTIERPRSALHSGDFTHNSTETNGNGNSNGNGNGNGRSFGEAAPSSGASTTGTWGVGTTKNVAGRTLHTGDDATWTATSPPRHYTPFSSGGRSVPVPQSSLAELGVFRSSAVPSPSSSLSSSFVYKPPTSPLVQSQSNYDDKDDDDDDADDADAADLTYPMNNIDIALGGGGGSLTYSGDRQRTNPRRHTLAFASHPHLHHFPSSPHPASFSAHPHPRQTLESKRRSVHFPYQAHQPRRSLSSTPNEHLFPPFSSSSSPPPPPLPPPFSSLPFSAVSTPQTPAFARSRRPSFGSDTSPLQHASMVGSYEESILRGRMSTTPSKPLDFLAQIGVLGLGAKCKSSLRCPPHVTLPFSAVFYSYATTSYGRSKADDGPSPYVGMVDLENGLPNSDADHRSKRKAMMPNRRTASCTRAVQDRGETGTDVHAPAGEGEDVVMDDVDVDNGDHADVVSANAQQHATTETATDASARSQKRRPHGPRAPPGGSYRIPPQGQLQIIIKNQNKTAVKLFLIPYDLTGMEPGTKTFIRQRSYSAGPIIDSVPALNEKASAERPILRYLIHLHICCPSRGRFYLYKSIRVVFANRVPDGKEKLRNELTFPEPRYSPYRPIRVMHHHAPPGTVGSGGPGAILAAEKAYRRRSSGFSFAAHGASSALERFGYQQRATSLAAVPGVSYAPSASLVAWQPNGGGHGGAADFNFADNRNAPVTPLPSGFGGSPTSSSTSRPTTQTSSVYAGASGTRTAGDGGLTGHGEDGETEERSHRARARDNTVPIIAAPTPPLYKKLSKGEIGYGGNAFAPMVNGSPAAAEGLLSQRLRSLEVRRDVPVEDTARAVSDE